MMAFKGVLNSWLTLAKNMLFAALAESASALAVLVSSIAVCSLVDISLKVLARSPISPESRCASMR